MNYILPFELDSAPGCQYEAELDIKYNISNYGLGNYEFWGQKCFDKGKPQIEIENYKVKNIYIDGNKIPPDLIDGKVFDIIDEKFHTNTTQESIKMEIWDNKD